MDLESKEEKYIGEVLSGQGWVELRGIFTIGELEELMERINSNYKAVNNSKREE
ncbi:hypothetical protein KAW18_16885 [candidate division WOR-3 bacterium]|nr:hypothetical protein [candidate division WOR-3 bacterium]